MIPAVVSNLATSIIHIYEMFQTLNDMPPLKLQPPHHANRSMSLYTTASYENQNILFRVNCKSNWSNQTHNNSHKISYQHYEWIKVSNGTFIMQHYNKAPELLNSMIAFNSVMMLASMAKDDSKQC